jgi:DNA recombination protein RmuC
LQEQLLALKKRNGELEAEVKFLNERLTTERQQIETVQAKFRADFEAISNKLLVDNTSKFNQQSSESLEKLLSPLRETFGEFKKSLETTRTETATHSALLKDQINRIGTEAANLSKALKGDVKALGNWGENMLDQILEKSGLQSGLHYRRQQSAKDGEGDQRFLDVIVDLPEKRNLIIDSKVSLRSYEEAVNATDEATRTVQLNRHVEALRNHYRGLGAKRYQDTHDITAPDFVLMYVPIESAFSAALAHDPKLWGDALESNVVLITNSSLLATLRTVAHVWRLADQQKYALEIAERGGKLYDKFVGFIEDLQDVGKALKSSQVALDAATSKLHTGSGNLVRQAEQMKTLGAKAVKSLPPALVENAGETEAQQLQIQAPES